LPGKTLVEKISSELTKRKKKIATAESCTGGLIAHTLTNISGSSNFFERGIVSYSNNSKIQLLDIDKKLIRKYGAVSPEVATAMAEGVRIKSDVDIGLSTTGIAGPTGGSAEKPVGLVYIGISTKKVTIVKKYNFSTDRLENKKRTCKKALELLYQQIKDGA